MHNKDCDQLNNMNNIKSSCSKNTEDHISVEKTVDNTSINMNSEINRNGNNTAGNKTKDKIFDNSNNEKTIYQPTMTPLDVIEVQHECFGMAWGQLIPKLYVSPDSKCITCTECCKYYLIILITAMY